MRKTLIIALCLMIMPLAIMAKKQVKQQSDREYWCSILYTMAQPILEPMSEGRLQQAMTTENGNLELSPTWDGRNKKVAYMEAFGRLMAGVAPWLALPDDDSAEGKQRHQLRVWALKAYANAVDPSSPDYLGWTSGGQTLVDGAYVAESFLRAWDALWEPLDATTKKRYVKEFQGLRRYEPPYQNWLIFVSLEECFLMKAQASLKKGGIMVEDAVEPFVDNYRIKMGINKIEEWYVGDGWYSDGPSFAFDYYNSYVIQPMYVECLQTICELQPNNSHLVRGRDFNNKELGPKDRLRQAEKRMQKYGVILERLISPEGTYPVFGRSIPYRTATMQPLALLALQGKLPEELHPGQIRAALTAVTHKMFDSGTNFNKDGFLTIGFVGSHPNVADWYTNNGSLYMASLSFLPLGLPADDAFWTSPAEKWTSKKAWEGDDFPKDHKWDINPQILYWE